jgi:hypothetical protein
MPVLRHFAAVCVGVADTNVADGIVADAGVVVVKGADINAGVNGVMAMQTAHCVAANDIVDNELPFSSIFFHLPNPFVNKDFTLRPTAAAACKAICTKLTTSNENIPRLIA